MVTFCIAFYDEFASGLFSQTGLFSVHWLVGIGWGTSRFLFYGSTAPAAGCPGVYRSFEKPYLSVFS